ncbi:MAG: PAS domain S-box protein [Methylobacter sp.]|nr:PAS domain S-box protein [Methylobacter sp.]
MAEDISAPAVFVADPCDGYRLLHASATCRHFGNSCETLLGMLLPEYIPTLTPARVKKLWQEVGKYRTASMETDYRLASGSRIAVEIIFSLLEHDGRELMVGYMRDISERRVLEAERLRLAEEVAGQEVEFRYREIFENVTDGIFLLDVVDGECFRYAGINPALARMSGLVPKNILGRFVEATLPEDAARKMIANYLRCVEEGKPIHCEMELELPTGRKVFKSTLIPVRDGLGYIHRIIGLTSDITERKAADKQLALLNYSLDHVKESVLLTGEDAQLYYVNEEFCRGLGYSRDELLGLGVSDFDPDYQLDRWPEHWRDLKENGSLIFESRHMTKDGRIYPVEIIANYFEFDGKGYNLALMRNIADRKRVDDTLKFIAQRGWAEGGESFLTALARYLGEMLEVDYVIVDKLADDPANAETVAIYAKGEVLPNMQYSLRGTPCANVMGGGLCCYPADVQQQFPEDSLLADMLVESYTGIPLWDSRGKVIGLIAVMDGKPMGDEVTVTSMLQLVATRAAAELEREQSERALSESRQFLNQVIETIPDPVFVKDREHRWIRLNQAYCEFIGHPLEALLGKSDYDFSPAHEAEVFWAKDEAVFNSGEENINEEEFTDRDGNMHTIVTKKSRYTDDCGQQYLVGIILDITERKRMEAELISQTNFQLTLLNAMYDVGMQLMVVESGRISHVGNRKLAYQFGYTDVELDAHPALIDIIHPDDRARVMDYHARRMAGEAVPTSYELGLFMRGGERREYETSVAIVPDTDPIRIITVGKDITERKRMEELLAQREREFRSLAENLPDNIARWDTAGRILFSNPTNQRTVGKPVGELIGKTFGEAFPDGRYAPVDAAVLQVLADGQPVRIERQLVPNENGGMDIHDINLVPEFDDAGQVVSVLGLGRDMTDIYRMQEAIAAREQEFRSLAESSPNSIIRYDREGRILYLNSGLARVMGVSADDVIGKLPSEAWPDGRYDVIQKAAAQAVEMETAVSIELCAQSAGEPDFYQIQVVPERDVAGQVVGTIAFGVDITAIRNVERRLTNFVANFPGFAYTFRLAPDGHGSFPFASPGIEKLYGLKPEDVKDDMAPIHALAHPDDRPRIEAAIAESARTMTPLQEEFRVCRPGLPERWIEFRSVPMIDADGSIVWHGLMIDITERKHMEDALHDRERMLNEAQAIAQLGSWDWDVVGNSVEWSDMAYDIYTPDERPAALGFEDFKQSVHPDDLDMVFAAVTTALEQDTPFDIEHRVVSRCKCVRTVHALGQVFRDAHGKPIRMVGTVQDITERKRVQDAIQRSQTLLEEAQRIAHIGSWEVNMVNDVLTWSDETFRIWEIDKAYFGATLEAFLETVHPEDREKVADAYHESVSNGTEYQIEHRLLFSDGRVKYIAERGKPFYDADGKPLCFVGTAQDITERKQMDAMVRQREQEFRVLVEYSPDPIFRYDKECRRTYANLAVERLTGKSAASLQNGVPSDASVVSASEGTKLVQAIRQVLETGQTVESEVEFIAPDGRLHYFHNRYAPEFGPHGEVAGVISIARDITEPRRQQLLGAERQRVFEKIAHGGDLSEILEQVSRYVESSKPGRHCCILLLDEERNCLYSAAAPSFSAPCLASLDGVAVRKGSCCGTAAWLGEWVAVEDIRHHACQESCQAFARETGVAACWSEPIAAPSGQVLGVVVIYLNHAGMPGDEDRALLRHASHLSSIAIERKRIEQQMYHQACYDPLTGLPNRRLFWDRLREEIAKAERGGYRLAVLFIDLDRFKEVNDTLGHMAGDGLLVEAAQRIRACVRESDTVARLAGDEFVVILPEVGEIVPQSRVAQCIVESMAQSFLLGEHNVYVSASVGIAAYPQDADNAETLICCADQAMYAAKEAGRNSFSFFTSGMLELAQQRLQLASDLREALGKGQLEVYYQPIIDVVSGQVVKAEALLRWQHPQRGMVSPDMFIPLAEETGAIHEIGDWVFRQAAGMALQWQTLCAMGNDSPALCQISVNMSPRQFICGNPDVAWVEHLQAIGLNPEAIVIEITEGLLLDDQADVLNKLQCFRQSGMQLALDDFGTGYSAMAYLKKFNIDYLKIDRSFVRDLETEPGDRAIAEAIVAMAHRLGLKVIAEGVETEGQCAILAEAGCEYVQGYLHAKPMPAEVFLEYVVGQSG